MMKCVLTADKLSVGYSTDSPVLRDICFNVNKGELVGLIGPNGAGKSTLLKSLRGILKPLEGEIYIADHMASALTDHEFACLTAYLQQDVHIAFDYSVREIVNTGRYPHLQWWEKEGIEDNKIVDACMEFTRVSELSGKSVLEISGGQRQRVLLAKVLAQQTPILFLDEPSTGLDIFYQEEMFRFCQELCRAGKTVLMVVHELSLAARFCSRLMLIGNHKVMKDGKPEDVLTEEYLTEAYGVPVRVVENPRTGHVEVYTEPNEKNPERKALLHVIQSGETEDVHDKE